MASPEIRFGPSPLAIVRQVILNPIWWGLLVVAIVSLSIDSRQFLYDLTKASFAGDLIVALHRWPLRTHLGGACLFGAVFVSLRHVIWLASSDYTITPNALYVVSGFLSQWRRPFHINTNCIPIPLVIDCDYSSSLLEHFFGVGTLLTMTSDGTRVRIPFSRYSLTIAQFLMSRESMNSARVVATA